jgi:hypothetical protein
MPMNMFIFISLAYIQVLPLSYQHLSLLVDSPATHLSVFLNNSLFIPAGVTAFTFRSNQFPSFSGLYSS